MSFTSMTDVLNVHQSRADQPTETASELKVLFDTDVNTMKTNHNALVTELNSITDGSAGADSVGHNTASITAANVGDALEENRVQIDAITADEFTHKNYLINGNFDVWQRGTSFTTPVDEYSADRWYSLEGAGDATVSRQAVTDLKGTEYSLRHQQTVTAGGGTSPKLHQTVERGQLYVNGYSVTVSYYAKTSDLISLIVSGIGTSTEFEFQVITTDGAWHQYESTLDFTGDALSNSDFEVRLEFPTTGTYTVDFAQVKFEIGATATSFIPKPNAEEFRDCLRYYWRGAIVDSLARRYAGNADTFQLAGTFSFHTQMRISPTMATITAPTLENCASVSLDVDKDSFCLRVQPTSSVTYRAHSGIYEADAEL